MSPAKVATQVFMGWVGVMSLPKAHVVLPRNGFLKGVLREGLIGSDQRVGGQVIVLTRPFR